MSRLRFPGRVLNQAVALLLLSVSASAVTAADFKYRVHIYGVKDGSLKLSFSEPTQGAIPAAKLGTAYAGFDFSSLLSVTGESSYTGGAQFIAAGLPDGMSVSTTGLLSGLPSQKTTPGGIDFNLVATYKDKTVQETFNLVVNGIALEASQVVTGRNRWACALTTAGGVKCWGNNEFGLRGTVNSNTLLTTPSEVSGLTSGVVQLAAGRDHACALLSSGGVKCWGDNQFGALGNGSLTGATGPQWVSGLSSGVKGVFTSENHTCAIMTSGGLKCWGSNASGQLGDDSAIDRASPVDVIGLGSDIVAVAPGGFHTCALNASGELYCWGSNAWGQSNPGLPGQSRVLPGMIWERGYNIADISAGYTHSCAVTKAGAALCWGDDTHGQLGNGITSSNDVLGLSSGVTAIRAGNHHTCAITNESALKCWGYNGQGQLGDGTTTHRDVPVSVLGFSRGAKDVSTVGGNNTCAATTSGIVMCWGYNGTYQLGNNSNTSSYVPTEVLP